MSALQSPAEYVFPLSIDKLPCTQVLEWHTTPHHRAFGKFVIGEPTKPFLLSSVQWPILSVYPRFGNLIICVKPLTNDFPKLWSKSFVLSEK